MEEKWKELEILGLQYLISNTGKIKGLGRNKELKQRYTKDGYLEVTVGKYNDKRTSRRVHTLVALAFVPKPNNYGEFEVNHKDTNRENNNSDNLEWVTHIENVRYSAKLGNYIHYGEDNSNWGGTTLKERFKNNPELCKTQARPREQNGRCVPLKMIDIFDNKEYLFKFIGECCEFLKDNYSNMINFGELNSMRTSVKKCIDKNSIYKKRFYFEEVCKSNVR